jgi:hypothetical protein
MAHLGLVHQVALQVEQQGAHALRAVVDGEQVGGGHGVSWLNFCFDSC